MEALEVLYKSILANEDIDNQKKEEFVVPNGMVVTNNNFEYFFLPGEKVRNGIKIDGERWLLMKVDEVIKRIGYDPILESLFSYKRNFAKRKAESVEEKAKKYLSAFLESLVNNKKVDDYEFYEDLGELFCAIKLSKNEKENLNVQKIIYETFREAEDEYGIAIRPIISIEPLEETKEKFSYSVKNPNLFRTLLEDNDLLIEKIIFTKTLKFINAEEIHLSDLLKVIFYEDAESKKVFEKVISEMENLFLIDTVFSTKFDLINSFNRFIKTIRMEPENKDVYILRFSPEELDKTIISLEKRLEKVIKTTPGILLQKSKLEFENLFLDFSYARPIPIKHKIYPYYLGFFLANQLFCGNNCSEFFEVLLGYLIKDSYATATVLDELINKSNDSVIKFLELLGKETLKKIKYFEKNPKYLGELLLYLVISSSNYFPRRDVLKKFAFLGEEKILLDKRLPFYIEKFSEIFDFYFEFDWYRFIDKSFFTGIMSDIMLK